MNYLFALITLLFWACADLFYKKGNSPKDEYSHLKTGMFVGITMGIHATIFLCIVHPTISLYDMFIYLPVSLCYIASMVIGYHGLKYIELSISSPICNSGSAITTLLLLIFFKITLSMNEIMGMICIFLGILFLSILEIKNDHQNIHKLFKYLTIQAIFYPLIYALFDGLGTFFDSIYLDQLNIMSSDTALVSYEYSFFIYAIIIYIILKRKKVTITLSHETNKIMASILETLGQFTYVYAISSNSIITIPVIACYGSLSILLARIFLKEKLTLYQYLAIIIIFLGILLLGIAESSA